MNFKEEAYLTLTGKEAGILGSEMYVLDSGLKAYDAAIDTSTYYLARDDEKNWRACAAEITHFIPNCPHIVEVGPGGYETAQKTARLVGAIGAESYTAIDVSQASLDAAHKAVCEVNSDIAFTGILDDFWNGNVSLPATSTSTIYAGGSIGNFDGKSSDAPPRNELIASLKKLSSNPHNRWLLVSVDTYDPSKSASYYEAAYSGDFHASFNLSAFTRMRDELDITIDPKGFNYKPRFNHASKAVEHFAIAKRNQRIQGKDLDVFIQKGQELLLQNSYKISDNLFKQAAKQVGLTPLNVWGDNEKTMKLYLLQCPAA